MKLSGSNLRRWFGVYYRSQATNVKSLLPIPADSTYRWQNIWSDRPTSDPAKVTEVDFTEGGPATYNRLKRKPHLHPTCFPTSADDLKIFGVVTILESPESPNFLWIVVSDPGSVRLGHVPRERDGLPVLQCRVADDPSGGSGDGRGSDRRGDSRFGPR